MTQVPINSRRLKSASVICQYIRSTPHPVSLTAAAAASTRRCHGVQQFACFHVNWARFLLNYKCFRLYEIPPGIGLAGISFRNTNSTNTAYAVVNNNLCVYVCKLKVQRKMFNARSKAGRRPA